MGKNKGKGKAGAGKGHFVPAPPRTAFDDDEPRIVELPNDYDEAQEAAATEKAKEKNEAKKGLEETKKAEPQKKEKPEPKPEKPAEPEKPEPEKPVQPVKKEEPKKEEKPKVDETKPEAGKINNLNFYWLWDMDIGILILKSFWPKIILKKIQRIIFVDRLKEMQIHRKWLQITKMATTQLLQPPPPAKYSIQIWSIVTRVEMT